MEFVLQQMHTALMALTSQEANDIVANSRKNPTGGTTVAAERVSILPPEEGRETFFARLFLRRRCSLLELQART